VSFKPAVALLLLPLTLAGCGVYREATSTSTAPPKSVEWRQVATDDDRERLRTWRQAWVGALAKARTADNGAIAADPELFDPDRALAKVEMPVGAYRCRTYKLGSAGTAVLDFTVYPWFDCRVEQEGAVRSLFKATGSQRPTGLMFADSDMRLIFLGTLVLGDETSPLRYGTDKNRDMVGYVERIGDQRWRLVFPHPRFESLLDVTELVPAG
jgi:hypothetical protein